MGFLDDAIVKTKEVFNVACQKTGEVVAVEKQKFIISSLKSKRQKDFVKLGKIYYDLVKDSTDISEDVKVLVDSITEKTEEIFRINEEIQNIKNKKACPYCGAGVDTKSTFCSVCGIKINNED